MTVVMTTTKSPRDRMVDSARELVQERGVHGVGLRDVVTHAGAPRGSLQHYFPGGKDQLLTEALRSADALSRRSLHGGDPVGVVQRVFQGWREILHDNDFRLGCPFAATLVDTGAANGFLRSAVADSFTHWHGDLRAILEEAGHPASRTTLVQAALQGALVLARAHRSTTPLDEVEAELLTLLAADPR